LQAINDHGMHPDREIYCRMSLSGCIPWSFIACNRGFR
jgi:hypothetical protein